MPPDRRMKLVNSKQVNFKDRVKLINRGADDKGANFFCFWGGGAVGGLMTMEGYSTARSRTCRSDKDFSPVSPFAVLKFFIFFYIFFCKRGKMETR